MTTYEITSSTGNTMGTYEGTTPAEALAAMHRDAGYRVRVDGGEIVFASEGDAEVCGGLDAWTVREVAQESQTVSLTLCVRRDGIDDVRQGYDTLDDAIELAAAAETEVRGYAAERHVLTVQPDGSYRWL